jgi:hypothetical protein
LHSEDDKAIAASILDKNKTHRDEMLRLVESREAIAFVGSGLSSPLYPTWLVLLRKLAEKAEGATGAAFRAPPDVSETDALDYAEALQAHFREKDPSLSQYYAIIGREFSGIAERCNDRQRSLVRLPFKGFVTTNYDEALEEAMLDCGVKRANCGIVIKRDEDHHTLSEFLLSLDDTRMGKRVAHLHGVWKETKHMILSRSDYERAYGAARNIAEASNGDRIEQWPIHRRLVWALLATRRMIFFGTSLDDPYLKALLRVVAGDLWNWDQSIHYAVLPLDNKSARRQQNDQADFIHHGVRIVYFDNQDGTYSALDQLINEALIRCGKQNASDWLESVNAETDRTLRPHEN